MVMRVCFILIISFLLIACGGSDNQPSPRTFRMGFQNSAPRLEFDIMLQSLEIWTARADAAIVSTEVPWDSLILGKKAPQYVANNFLGLVNYYRSKQLKVWVYIDPQNGLNRASDADQLVARGKSIADADMQALYTRFVVVMDSMLLPDHLGLALETNLIRTLSTPALYNGVVTACNQAAAEVRARGSQTPLSVSIQADDAWGKFTDGAFKGIDQDFIDFPFVQEVGISSYPYFFFNSPADIPADYFSRLFIHHKVPCFASEGGWTTKAIPGPTGGTLPGSETIQQDYLLKQAQLLSSVNAIGWFQLTFTDIDLSSLPAGTNPTIEYFAYLGLVDANLKSRAGLGTWDGIFGRPLAK